MSAAIDQMLGTILGNYVVRSVLGQGGMGAVYAAEHRFLGDRVAVKVLHGNFKGDSDVAERFFQEARAAREIDHENVIKIFDFGETDDGVLYLVMEHLEGQSLEAMLQDGALTEESAAHIIAEVADGLAAAHRKGIVHRDLKPANIFLAGEKVKLLDFGIAKFQQAQKRTETGVLLGTPAYMAPEQARGTKHVGPATDIYALGVILFEALTGKTPFDDTDLRALYAQIFFKPPRRPSKLAPISPAMETLILQCLEKEIAPRPVSMEEVRDRLRALSGPASAPGASRIALRPTDPHMPVVTAGFPNSLSSSGELFPRVPAQEPPPARKSPVGFALAGAATLLAASLALAVYHFSTPAPVASPIAPAVAPPARALTGGTRDRPIVVTPMPDTTPQPSTVVVRSDPPGAEILVDERPAGRTPAILSLKLPHEVQLRLPGWQPAREVLSAPGETRIKMLPLRRTPATGKPAPHKPLAPRETLD